MEMKKNSILPASKNKKMRKIDKRTKRISICLMITILSCVSCVAYDAMRRQVIYDSLNISFAEVKDIEYGTANYNALSLVKHTNEGSKTKVKSSVDTSKLGKQEIVFEVSKDGIKKEIATTVEVKDTNAPEVTLKQEEIVITEGEDLDLISNIESVTDKVDGDLAYAEGEAKEANYTVTSDFDKSKPGEYEVTISATDINGNTTQSKYKVKVNGKPKPVVQPQKQETYTNGAASVDTSSVIGAATSLIGTRYRSGGTSPETGFDCSGFVKYVYSLFGVSLSGGSSSQLHAGSAVSEDAMQAGDIIIWANNGSNSAAHSSIYAGDGTIIHATTNKGVQKTSLSNWKAWGQHIIGIRRV
ncbi:MAG: C40 family peptidase [Bacilli bacterium]|nr:C40 family peptidase [Bacilli bacterium]